MAKLNTTPLANLESQTTAVQSINNNFEAVEAAFENTLSRDGTSPNSMGANLDMNSHRILNLPEPTSNGEPLRLGDVGGVLPADIAAAAPAAAAAAVSAAQAAASAVEAASYVGAATQAPKWSTPRSITVGGDVSGTSAAWDGSANLTTFNITINNGSVTAAKLASGAALSNLGFTPANLSGAEFSGNVRLNFVATHLHDDSAGFRGLPPKLVNSDYVFIVDDCGRMIRHTSGTAHGFTLNPYGSTPYQVGGTIVIRNVGTGIVNITRGSGVNLRKAGSSTSQDIVVNQWGLVTLIQEEVNVWVASGTGMA